MSRQECVEFCGHEHQRIPQSADNGGSFLDCSGVMSTHLLDEAILDEGMSEGTCRPVGMLLELEHPRGWAVGHLLSSTIMMDCNLKLIHHNVLLPSMILSCVLATEAYQLPFNPLGSTVFGVALPALLEKAGEVKTQRDTSLSKRHSLNR